MQKLNIVSMDFTESNTFCCARKRARREQEMMEIASSYIYEDSNPIVLLQGKSLDSRVELITHHFYQENVDCENNSAILVPRNLDVVKSFSFRNLGSGVMFTPEINHYLFFFSLSFTKKKDLENFDDYYRRFLLPDNSLYLYSHVIAGSFPSRKLLMNFAEYYHLADVSSYFYSDSSELKNDRYSILLSNDISFSDTTRHTGLVKAKYLKHCPISTKISL